MVDAAAAGWTMVSDTAWEGYEQIPRWIMAGYTRSLDEVVEAGLAPLRCAEVSTLAWPVLRDVVDHAVTVTDAQASEALRRLREPLAGDPPVNSGPCGAATLAALVRLVEHGQLDGHTTALLLNTEAG